MSVSARKVALVTGGGRRIGAAISRRLSRGGFSVVLTYRDKKVESAALAGEIGGEARFLDLRRPRSFKRLAVEIVKKYGRLDLLVHNAAVFPRMPAGPVSADDWDAVFDVNLRGPFLLTQALLPLLRRPHGGGSVLFIGDAGAGKLWPAYMVYCLSKLALEDQARAMRKALSPAVRVGIVRPGLALIPDGFPKEEWDRLRSRGDLRKLDSPDKVAGAVLRFALRGR
jgi:pteridine reductase